MSGEGSSSGSLTAALSWQALMVDSRGGGGGGSHFLSLLTRTLIPLWRLNAHDLIISQRSHSGQYFNI